MYSNMRTKKVLIPVVCFLIVGTVFLGSLIGSLISSRVANAAPVAASHSHTVTSTMYVATNNAAAFRVTSIDMSVTPSNVSLWKCGSYIQVVYNAVFHVVSGPNGGTIVFYYTINNGRGQTLERLTILPGQRMTNYTFSWQGSLPSDHFYPENGGVQVTTPNNIVSHLVGPAGRCR